jgi:hypothetical protein
MSGNRRASNRALVASRRHDYDSALRCVIERLCQYAFAFSQWYLRERRAQIQESSASINTFDNSSGELLGRCAWN